MSIELNKIYNMNCLDGLKLVDDNSVDLIVTSPPYNLGIKYDSWNDEMPWEEYLDFCKDWLKECYRVLRPDGRICVDHYFSCGRGNVNRFPLFDLKNIMDEIGYKAVSCPIWNDITITNKTAWGSWMSASAPYINCPIEGILIACKDHWKKDSSGESTVGRDMFIEATYGVWNIGTTTGQTIACFPEKLPEMCIQLLSYKDDVILDPFSGSGTTCYVAKNLGRKYLGFEISKNYYDVSVARLSGVRITAKDVEEAEEIKTNLVSLW